MLASASPRRLALLAQIGIVPDLVLPADIDESSLPDETARMLALRLALGKAEAASRPGAVTLAADTVVSVGRRLLGKAETEEEARRFLRLLSGRRHQVTTAVALRAGGRVSSRVVQSAVAFSRLTEVQVEHLLACGDWRGKAGAYAVQGHAASVVRFLSGSYSGVVGLPLFETAQLLRGHRLLP